VIFRIRTYEWPEEKGIAAVRENQTENRFLWIFRASSLYEQRQKKNGVEKEEDDHNLQGFTMGLGAGVSGSYAIVLNCLVMFPQGEH
jgi:hypothetical protein